MRSIGIGLVLLAAMAGGAALMLGFWPERPQETPRGFAEGSYVVLEDDQDYPGDPRALHAPTLHVLARDGVSQRSFTAESVSRNRPTVLTEKHLYYFDPERLVLVDATTDEVLEGSQVSDERFGGFVAVTADQAGVDRVAFGRTTQKDTEYLIELVVEDKVVWSETSASELVVVPHAWSQDGETIFFSAGETGRARTPKFQNLYHLRLIEGQSEIEASEVPFPSDTAELLDLSQDTNLAVFLDETSYYLVNVATGAEEQIDRADTDIVSCRAGDDFAAVTTADQALLILQFGVADPLGQALEGEDNMIVDVRPEGVYVTRGGSAQERGTYLIDPGSKQAPRRLSEWLWT